MDRGLNLGIIGSGWVAAVVTGGLSRNDAAKQLESAVSTAIGNSLSCDVEAQICGNSYSSSKPNERFSPWSGCHSRMKHASASATGYCAKHIIGSEKAGC